MFAYLAQRFSGGKSSEDGGRGRLAWDHGSPHSPPSQGWAKVGLRPRAPSQPGDISTTRLPLANPSTEEKLGTFRRVQPTGSPTRLFPPNVSWLSDDDRDTPRPPSPHISNYASSDHAPQRHLSPIYDHPDAYPNMLSPSTSTSTISPAPSTPRWGLRLQTDPALVGSTPSLNMYTRQTSLEDPQGVPFAQVKQLSPIAEQDYLSPTSLRTHTRPPSDHDASHSQNNRSPNESQHSDITSTYISFESPTAINTTLTSTEPSPVFAPFISRPLNRTLSQNSSRTHISTTSTIVKNPSPSVVIPPLDLRPPFPGPHPSNSYNASVPSLRPLKSATTPTMPTIAGSSEDYGGETSASGDGSRYSLHADSFVTATDSMNGNEQSPRGEQRRPAYSAPALDMDITEVPTEEHQRSTPTPSLYENPFERESRRGAPTVTREPSTSRSIPMSVTSSGFIMARWDRDAALGTGTVSFPRVKKRRLAYTPACWMFWLCFLCPPLWFIGGWYITIFAEAYTFRDPDDDWHWWGVRQRAARKRRRKLQELQLPQWVRDKQQISDGASSTRRALRGISFLYPFVARPIDPPPSHGLAMRMCLRTIAFLGKMNRLLDRIPCVKLAEVDGERETDRRMFDPWIQRCRYAWCWFFILWCFVGVPSLFIIRQYCNTCFRDTIL
ncbi:hypothetical protein PC9H_000400 [Pleurotus ostreatus]|uniref:Uncharacterized protein n=1 Tax=Pleurotus ostreatus TaxID=5322 RepID=A0A8H7A1W0_PLEOS|nr:uncharacterized protein PC9H_000400 [Pleurotus ostreatus]KAF7440058.1 hypothetical protein PC9H_000400 [Pleurotus ostreatus]